MIMMMRMMRMMMTHHCEWTSLMQTKNFANDDDDDDSDRKYEHFLIGVKTIGQKTKLVSFFFFARLPSFLFVGCSVCWTSRKGKQSAKPTIRIQSVGRFQNRKKRNKRRERERVQTVREHIKNKPFERMANALVVECRWRWSIDSKWRTEAARVKWNWQREPTKSKRTINPQLSRWTGRQSERILSGPGKQRLSVCPCARSDGESR